jgi:vacuolar protein sorting-associated protein IST1
MSLPISYVRLVINEDIYLELLELLELYCELLIARFGLVDLK